MRKLFVLLALFFFMTPHKNYSMLSVAGFAGYSIYKVIQGIKKFVHKLEPGISAATQLTKDLETATITIQTNTQQQIASIQATVATYTSPTYQEQTKSHIQNFQFQEVFNTIQAPINIINKLANIALFSMQSFAPVIADQKQALYSFAGALHGLHKAFPSSQGKTNKTKDLGQNLKEVSDLLTTYYNVLIDNLAAFADATHKQQSILLTNLKTYLVKSMLGKEQLDAILAGKDPAAVTVAAFPAIALVVLLGNPTTPQTPATPPAGGVA